MIKLRVRNTFKAFPESSTMNKFKGEHDPTFVMGHNQSKLNRNSETLIDKIERFTRIAANRFMDDRGLSGTVRIEIEQKENGSGYIQIDRCLGPDNRFFPQIKRTMAQIY